MSLEDTRLGSGPPLLGTADLYASGSQDGPGGPMARLFRLQEKGTTARTEVIAGATTFLTMAYIMFVNPDILSTTGMDRDAVFVATCLAAALGSAIMGLWANWPIGMAPGMGLNAFFAFTVVGTMGYSWQEALGAVFISGLVFLFLSLTGIRRWLIAGIPHSMRSAIAAGIGLFLAIIALKSSGLVVASPATLVTLGDLTSTGVLLTVGGFFIIAALDARKVPGAILIGILAITGASIALGVSQFGGVVSPPPSILPTFLQLDVGGALGAGILHVVLVMVLVEVFDATGTLIGVAKRAGLLVEGPAHKSKGLSRALMADSTAILAGSMLGTSSTTAYVESASGVQAGGRTGLTALTVATLFLLSTFLSPLAGSVPVYATAPALLYVATLMLRELSEVSWEDVTESAPAVLTAVAMPFTYSIANGLAFGFVSYALIKLLTGRAREVHAATWIVAALFVARFVIFPNG
ncbi:Xanthine/uracil/thiamine/ascorbate permease family protein [Rubellimicrobium mesophilum DSM 19309]|uniref:Xanthine/uracil/thiamine/ascorbate permease family protein n=1 Tax=Rubellimicrobium mesophilum DSM 19309 TaxID=442562 RepID=A0A017HIS3_9RHOB|nr:NCS2 family permease [Rubellimicrobium mesophilum]EYD74261.1 Xanthine/uracil/thiamine/ascorbate permease family protein [Rubellimicrobium mesophilum DSM 19309]